MKICILQVLFHVQIYTLRKSTAFWRSAFIYSIFRWGYPIKETCFCPHFTEADAQTGKNTDKLCRWQNPRACFRLGVCMSSAVIEPRFLHAWLVFQPWAKAPTLKVYFLKKKEWKKENKGKERKNREATPETIKIQIKVGIHSRDLHLD